jgi:hypothetical protein
MYLFAIYARDSTEPPHRADPIRRINAIAIAIAKPLLRTAQQWAILQVEGKLLICLPAAASIRNARETTATRSLISSPHFRSPNGE